MPTRSKSRSTGSSRAAARGKFTEADIRRNIQKMKDAAEADRKTFKEAENFISLTEEEMRKKLKRVNSPLINSMGWSQAPPGGTVNIGVGIFNPDPVPQFSLYVHLWVGPGNPVIDDGAFLQIVDARFPRLAQPPAFGVTLAPGEPRSFVFPFKIPSNVEPGTYLCNFVLIRLGSFEPGIVFDRSALALTVT